MLRQSDSQTVRQSDDVWGYVAIVAVILLPIVMSIKRIIPTIYFYPINGTYQNYNVVRRLMAGEIPCVDFSVYLGMGHLYLGEALTILLGGDLRACVFSYQFLTTLSLMLLVISLGIPLKLSTKKICVSILLTFLGVCLCNVDELIHVSNSARLVRAMVLYIDVLLLYRLSISAIRGKIFIIGIITGATVTYSNDYGIATAATIFFLNFIAVSTEKSLWAVKIKDISWLILGTLIGLLGAMTAFTYGHPLAWYSMNFSIGDFQSWYYNSAKSYYLYDINTDVLSVLQMIFVVYCIRQYLKTRKCEFFVLAMINLASELVVQESTLLSGGGVNIANLNFFVSILMHAVMSRQTIWKTKYFARVVVSLAVIHLLILVGGIGKHYIMFKNEDYSSQAKNVFGANLSNFEADVVHAADFLQGKKVFSTYASALEDYTHQFQPSGYDYIIHVLGDEARKKYLEDFRRADFTYVVTQGDYTKWSNWARNANWFFYREVYADYVPVYKNGYEVFWERATVGQSSAMPANSQISVAQLSDGICQVDITTATTVNGVADVLVEWQVDLLDRWQSRFVFRRDVRIIEVTENDVADDEESDVYRNFYLPGKGACYIPITLKDGHGQVIIQANPGEVSKLSINKVLCERFFDKF